MIIPLSPYLARQFGADDLQVGLLMSVYSLAQFLFAPLWGVISDYFGRRPVILICLLLECLFYILFSFAQSLEILFLTRVFMGGFGAVMAISMAYIADVTVEKERSKNMGLVGAAIGLGFVVGPFLGGVFGFFGQQLGDIPPFGSSFSAFGACLVCAINFVIAYVYLKEHTSRVRSSIFIQKILSGIKNIHQSRIKKIFAVVQRPVLAQILSMYFLLTFALATIETSLFLYVKDKFAWSHLLASLGFTYIGLMMVFTQGFLVRKWIPKWGEKKIALAGLAVASIGFTSISWMDWAGTLAFSVTLLCLGYGLATTCLSGAASLLTQVDKQGRVFGVQQSLFALARITGPALGGWFYRDFSHSSPFYFSGLLTVLALLVGLRLKGYFPQKGKHFP